MMRQSRVVGRVRVWGEVVTGKPSAELVHNVARWSDRVIEGRFRTKLPDGKATVGIAGDDAAHAIRAILGTTVGVVACVASVEFEAGDDNTSVSDGRVGKGSIDGGRTHGADKVVRRAGAAVDADVWRCACFSGDDGSEDHVPGKLNEGVGRRLGRIGVVILRVELGVRWGRGGSDLEDRSIVGGLIGKVRENGKAAISYTSQKWFG